ncbi:MAG: hypothetical protein ACK53C_17190 [Pseudomonadota bacterium]
MAVPLENADRATAPPPADAAAAMNRVLATERATLAELVSERARCDARVAAARRAASARVDRAEAVARAIHARTESVATARAARVAAAAARSHQAAPVALAVERVLRWLLEPDDE